MMKRLIYPIILGIAVLSVSCSRTPEACLNTPKTVVDLGESITFENCTERTSKYEIDFGDGNSADDDDSDALTHAFEKPGTFVVTLEAEHEKSGNKDEMSVTVTVNEPDPQKLRGNWNMYKREDYVDLGFFGESVEVYEENTDYEISGDSMKTEVDGRITAIYAYDLFSNAELRLQNAGLYSIVKLSTTEMVWQDGDEDGGLYSRLYFVKR